MDTTTETLTMEQAIENGYTHFIEEEGESIVKFSSIKEEDRQYFREKKYFIVDMKTPLNYTISADTIKELISEYVGKLDEMADEDEKLFAIADEQDYSKLAEELNAKFSAVKYYKPSEIEVTF